jgi:hypothetical protein
MLFWRTSVAVGVIAGMLAWPVAGCSGKVDQTPAEGGTTAPDAPASPDTGSAVPPQDSGGGRLETSTPPSGDTCQSPGVSCTLPPGAPSGATPPAGSTSPHNYALHKLYLGDTDRTGVASSEAWQGFGYNLDDRVTTAASTDVCTLAAGASKSAQLDGMGGIDNSFGENILPILLTLAGSDFSAKMNAVIEVGVFTNLLYVTGFDDLSGNTTTATGLSGVFLGGGNYLSANDGGEPIWNLGTQWPIRPETLTGCPGGVCPPGTDPVSNAAAKFSSAYQRGGTFVNESPVDIPLILSAGPAPFTLPVHSATVTFVPDVPGSVTGGTLAGVLATSELVSSLQVVAGSITPSLCAASAFQSIARQVEQAADIVLDPGSGGVSNSAGVACNGISIGLGFDGTEIAPPSSSDITGPTPAPPNPCGGP